MSFYKHVETARSSLTIPTEPEQSFPICEHRTGLESPQLPAFQAIALATGLPFRSSNE